MAKILVIAAHPDDEVLGCGGSIAKYAELGHETHIAILGEGITSRYTERDQADSNDVRDLHQKSRDAAKIVGATNVTFHGLPDNRFDTIAMLDVVKILEELIEEIQPEQVYTQHGGDLNIDHVVTYRATLTATRPMKDHCVRSVYAYEVASSTEWSFSSFSPQFRPSLFVDISRFLEHKVRAMQVYESEARNFPHPRSPQALRAAATRWGSQVGLDAAEVFTVIREIR